MRRRTSGVAVHLLTYDPSRKTFSHKPRVTRFLRGPIPWDWIEAASKLPGRALEVGLCLWRSYGVTKELRIRLGSGDLHGMDIDRRAKSRALKALQTGGLVSMERAPGKLSVVTIVIDNERSTEAGSDDPSPVGESLAPPSTPGTPTSGPRSKRPATRGPISARN